MENDPIQQPEKPVDTKVIATASVSSDAEEYIKKVNAGQIVPSREDLRGFLPKTGIDGGYFGSGSRASNARLEAQTKAEKGIVEKRGDGPAFPTDKVIAENAGLKAGFEQQTNDVELASQALLNTIKTDPMFFRGMSIHQKILAGETPFELDADGVLTDKGRMDAADYEYFYGHDSRGITFAHGAEQMLATIGSEIQDTIEHLVSDTTAVINPSYKDKPNWEELQSEAKAFVMQGVQIKITSAELKSGQPNKEIALHLAELQGRKPAETLKERIQFINLYRRYLNPPEYKDKEGKTVKPDPLFVEPGFWQSGANKTAGSVESAGRVLKGWYNLAMDASKDPLSWHGQLTDEATIRVLRTSYEGIKDDPDKQEEAKRILRRISDPSTIRAARINMSAKDIADMNKWASGENMILKVGGDSYIQPDPNIWSPGQTWTDPLMLWGLGAGAFRAMKAASSAEAAMMSKYAAIAKLASVEAFSLDVATVTKQMSGMAPLMEAMGREAATVAGMNIAAMTPEQLVDLGLKSLLKNPMGISPQLITQELIDGLTNSIPKPAAVAMTEEAWQLLPGAEKIKNLDPPAGFAGVPEGADIWNRMTIEQRTQVLVGEKTSEIYKLSRARQAKAIAEAQAGAAAGAASAAEHGNASVARRSAGAFTSAFGEWAIGGRELGRGFFRDLSMAGLLNGSADALDWALRGSFDLAVPGSGASAEQWLRDLTQAKHVGRTMYALGAVAGVNIIGSTTDSPLIQWPRYVINTLGFIAGARVLGATTQNIGKFMKVWGDEIARGDPTLWRGYANKIAKNPEAYGFDPANPFGPQAVASLMARSGIERTLRFGKRALYDFGVKGGGVAELMVYGKDRDTLGQGFAIGTAFSGVGYYMGFGINATLGRNRLNAMRSDALFRIGATADGDPTSMLNFVKAHEIAVKGNFEQDFLGFVLGLDNSTRGRVRFINGKEANVLRFAYDYGLKDQSESIRRQVALGFRTPEDIIGARLRQEEVGRIATDLRNKLAEETRTLDLEFEKQRDVAKQLTERLKDPRLTKEEKMDIGTQKMFVTSKIREIQGRRGQIKESLKQTDNYSFIKDQGVNLDTMNARVRAGVNEVTGNPLITFKGLTIETTKDGPIVYINTDMMTTKALWHEAAEAVLLAGGVESVVGDATRTLFGNVAKNPGQLKLNKERFDEANKNSVSTDTYEFFTTGLSPESTMGAVLDPTQIAQMIRAHRESANLDATWETNAFAAVREYMTTGNKSGIESLSREIMANYVGLHLEQGKTIIGTADPLRLYNNGSFGMKLYGFSERVINIMKSDTALNLEARAQIAGVTDDFLGGTMTPQNIRGFFLDPATGQRITITPLERLSREAIRRSNKKGIDKEGRALVDLRKMQPDERRAWVTANNVSHWVNERGELRDPKEIVRVEAEMTNASIIGLEEVRQQFPNIVRGVKKVQKTKEGETHTVSGNISAPEIHAMLNNPDLPENVRNTLLAYSQAVFRSDGRIGLIQGMYSGESKEVVYTPQSTPSLREWGSPLLAPEHRALLPLDLSIAWDTDQAGAVVATRISINGLDWGKGIEPRVRIAAGSDLAKAHGLTMSDLYGYMEQYIQNLNKGTGNALGVENAKPSAKLFDPTGTNPTRGENIRDLMHFIFDFQKKKGDAYINNPADWGELGLRGPTHPYTNFRADRWVAAQADTDGRFVRVSNQAYQLSQGNFMGAQGDNVPPRKLNRADVGEQSADKEAAAVQRAIGEPLDIPPPTEKGKIIDPTLPILPPDIMGVISDIYSFDGKVIPKAVYNYITENEAQIAQKAPKTVEEYVDVLSKFVEIDLSNGSRSSRNTRERARYVKNMIYDLSSMTRKHVTARTSERDAATAQAREGADQVRRGELEAQGAAYEANNAARDATSGTTSLPTQDKVNVATPMTEAAKKDLAMFNDQISQWREMVDIGTREEAEGVEVSLSAAELPFYKKELRKFLDKAFAIKPDFDPGFDVQQYFPDYQKPEVRSDVQAAIDAEARAVREAQAANRPTGTGDAAVVAQFKEKTTDILTKIAVMREPGSKEIPLVIKTINSKNGMGGVIADLLLKLEKNDPGVDYINAAALTEVFSKSLTEQIAIQSKLEQASNKAKKPDKAQHHADLRTQLEALKNTVDGINEYATGIADTAPSRQGSAGATKPKVTLADRQVYENGAAIINKDAPWVEGIPTKVEKPLGQAVLKLAEEVITIDGKGLDAKETTYYYNMFKAAKDAGVTAEQFWTMYELDDAGARAVVGHINQYAKKKDGQELFPYVAKKNRPNLLAPEDVALEAIAAREKKGGKPKKPAAEAERPYWENRIDALGDIISTGTYPAEDFNGVKKGATKNDHIRSNTEYLYEMFKEGKVTYEQIVESLRSRTGDDKERVTAKGKPADKKELARSIAYFETHWKNLVAQDKKNQPAATAEATPAPAAEATKWNTRTDGEGIKMGVVTADKDGLITYRTKGEGVVHVIQRAVYNTNGSIYEYKEIGTAKTLEQAQAIYAKSLKDGPLPGAPESTTEAAPAPTAEPAPTVPKPKGAAADDGVVLGDDISKWPKAYQEAGRLIEGWFDNHATLRTDPNDRYKNPTWSKNDATKAANQVIAELEKAGVTPAMARKIYSGYEGWTGTAKWDKEALGVLRSWITSDMQGGAKPKPKNAGAAPVIPPELAPTTEPTTTGKPTLSDKEVKTRLRELEGKLEEMYELDDLGEDSSDTQGEAQDIITALRNAGVEKDAIQDILDNSSVGGDYGWNLNTSTPKGGSSGAKPPKPPKPTAQAAGAGDEAPAPKPKVPRQPDFEVPDAPLNESVGFEYDWTDLNNPKKDPNHLKKTYGTKVRAEVDKRLAQTLDRAEQAVKAAMDIARKEGKGYDTKAVNDAYNELRNAMRWIEANAEQSIDAYGIDFFDMSPKVRERFSDIYSMDTADWWSKTQKTRQKNVQAQVKDYIARLDKVTANRVVDDMLRLFTTETLEKTGDPKKGNYRSKQQVLASKDPWAMADDRTLLPLSTRLDDFIVTEKLVDPDTKTGAVGTSGLIFIDTKAKTAFNEPAHINIVNSIMGTRLWDIRGNGFMDLQVLNANGDRKVFRISTQGNKGMTEAQLKKAYAEAVKKQKEGKEPGEPMPALQFDMNGTSFQANKEGLLLMNAEITEFLRAGQLKKNAAAQTNAAKKAQELQKQQRQKEATDKEAARKQAETEAQEEAVLRLGLFGRQPLDPNNPMTAMSLVTGEKKVVSRRADNLVEVHDVKGKNGSVLKVQYLGDDFGGPRTVLTTVSSKAAMHFAQAFDPFTGYREAVLNMVEGLDFSQSGPWPDKDGNPTTNPKLAASLGDLLKGYDKQFTDIITRIRGSGTYGIIDIGNNEVLVVPKKSIRDKDGNLDMANQVKLSRRLLLKAQNIVQTAETQAQQRRAANARPPAPRIDPATGRPPQPGAKPAPAATPPPAGVDVQSFMNERMNATIQTARNTQGIARGEAASGVVRILQSRDNFRVVYMKDGTIRVYGANANLLAVTKDEEDAFSWLIE